MKIVVFILFFIAAMAAVPTIFGISRAEYSSPAGWVVEKSSPGERVSMAILTAACVTAAIGSIRRWRLAWWIVATGWVVLGFAGLVTAIVKTTELSFLAAFVDFGMGLLMLWSFRKFWLTKRAEFRPHRQHPDLRTRQHQKAKRPADCSAGLSDSIRPGAPDRE